MNTLKKTWLNVLLAPAWFIVNIIILSIYIGSTGVAGDNIASHVEQMTGVILLFSLSMVLLTLYLSGLISAPSGIIFDKNWQKFRVDIITGAIAGLVLLGAYIWLIMPIQYWLQHTFGDYVPVGATTQNFSQYPVLFFGANVVLAPFVEEKLYRGIALDSFQKHYGTSLAVGLSALLFGLLHWLGGFWYMVITAVVIGIPFAIIAMKRASLYWVFAAHFSLNIGEFLYLTQYS